MLPREADRLRARETELMSAQQLGYLSAHALEQLPFGLATGLLDRQNWPIVGVVHHNDDRCCVGDARRARAVDVAR